MKRAAIYIRVSRERQAEKVSPQAQESDCRAYCEAHNYTIVDIYADTEKYRSSGRLVEPSGRRNDRPAMKRLLSDADAGKIDLVIAWREDRLYRGVTRTTLEISERVAQNVFGVELVKEHYDPTIAPVKAWAAGVELAAKSDRMNMGISARFAAGKVWAATVPYGYMKVDDYAEINPDEAPWLQRIWEWAGADMAIQEIRNRLIEGGAPQRNSKGIPWQIPFLYQILRNPVYHTGIQEVTWDGKTYEVPYPILVDAQTVRAVDRRKSRNKAHPARNVKHNYLGMGLLYCSACNIKMSSFTSHVYKNGKRTKRIRSYYRCGHYVHGYPSDGCAQTVSTKVMDERLWKKVWEVFKDGEKLEKGINAKVAYLRAQEGDAKSKVERINREIDNLQMERAWVITQARKKAITESDMETQLGILTAQEKDLRSELSNKSLLIGNRSEQLLEVAQIYREQVLTGAAVINGEPAVPEEQEEQFQFRRKIVQAIVTRVDVFEDKSISVDLEITLPGDDENKEAPLLWR